jgi:Ser/Thr protein kinase RdoA (MazF antagonist)
MENRDWIGLRERDNFFYTKGEAPLCDLDCHNSIIVSNLEEGSVKGISNHALIKDKGKSYLIPITEIDEIVKVSSVILNKEKIFYKKPKSISERESLRYLSKEEIKQKILDNYNLDIDRLSEMKNKKGQNRIYKLISKEDEEFILKYRGNNLDLFDAQFKLLEGLTYFPKIIPTLNSHSHVLFDKNIYAVEEFIKGKKFPLNNANYFDILGKNLAFMHNDIFSKTRKDKNLEDSLVQEGDFLNESNLISVQIDLRNNLGNDFLLKEIELFSKDTVQRLRSLPDQIIHGDLNRSNLIWNGNNVKMIDSENIRFSKRIREFIPILLFKGNFQIPNYIQNSAIELLKSYNSYSNNKLSKNEWSVIPELLKFSLVKLYAIYNLRRNKDKNNFRKQIISNLKTIGGEFNVY